MLTLEEARQLVDAAIAKATALHICVSVAVVDAEGHLKQISRMDNAGWFSPEIALAKARAATAFRRDTSELGQRFGTSPFFAHALSPISGGKLMLADGGLVVRRGDEVIGGVCVSGATVEQDLECARAALAVLSG